MKMNFNYALINDNSMQWFAYLIAFTDNDEVLETYSLPNIDHCKTISDAWSRPLSFSNKSFICDGQQQSFYGVYISQREFERIRRIIELYPSVREFNQLMQY